MILGNAWIHSFWPFMSRLESLALDNIQSNRRLILNAKLWRIKKETIALSFLRIYGHSQMIKKMESVAAIIFYVLKTNGIKISIKPFSGILIDGKEGIVIILISHSLHCLCLLSSVKPVRSE